MRARTGHEPEKPARGRREKKGETPARGARQDERVAEAQVKHARSPRAGSGSTELFTPSIADSDDPLLAESGAALDPEDLGVRFLRDATGQDNFESRVKLSDAAEFEDDDDDDLVPPPSAAIDAALADDLEPPQTDSFIDFIDTSSQNSREPSEAEIDLTSGSIHLASLFDQPVADDALEEPASEFETLQPALHTEDPSEFAEARERAINRRRHELLAKRRQAEAAATGKDKS